MKLVGLFLSIFAISTVITSLRASAPASEFLLDRVYASDDSPGKFMNMSGYKVKRANRTTFLVGGDILLLQPMDDEITVRVSIIAVDQGGDKYLFTRDREKICSFIFKECQHCKDTLTTANFKPMPESCPMKEGLYEMPMQPVARLRKDWPKFLQVLIPPLVPFENWKLDLKFFRKEELQDEVIMAFRLVNELSAV